MGKIQAISEGNVFKKLRSRFLRLDPKQRTSFLRNPVKKLH